MNCLKCRIPLYEKVDFCPTCGAAQAPSRGRDAGKNAIVMLLGLGLLVGVMFALWLKRSHSLSPGSVPASVPAETRLQPGEPRTVQPTVNLPALIGQPSRVVDSALGKPTEVTKVTGNREYVPGEYREYIISGVQSRRTTKDGLMVRFYKGKAIRFTLDLPQPAANAKEALKMAGIDVGERLPDVTALAAERWDGIFINGRTCSVKAVRVWIEPSQRQAYDLVQVETEP